MQLNTCEICSSSDVSTYNIDATPNKDRYLNYFGCQIIRRNCPTEGWVWENRFGVDVSVEIQHGIQMTLNDCIVLAKANINLSISPIREIREHHPTSKLIGATHKSSVLANKYNVLNIQSDTTYWRDSPIK